MARVDVRRATTMIDAPPSFVFDFLADPITATLIDPAVRSYVPDTVPMGVGTRCDIRLRLLKLPARAESIVCAWEPGRLMRFETLRPRWPVVISAEHEFERVGDGCRYTWSLRVAARRGVGPIARVVAGALAANSVRQGALVKAEVERRHRSGSENTG